MKSKILLLILLFGIVLTACSVKEENKNTNKVSESDGDKISNETQVAEDDNVTFDWYVNYSWFTTPWGDNLVSKEITERTGVDINFITPIGNETEKLNALISSDSLPDIITLGYWEPQVEELINKEMVYALNELADEYAPYFWNVADQDVINWYTREDGNVYAYPNSSVTPHDLETNEYLGSNQTFLVRKDIYEAIGSPDMTTTEGFMGAVQKAVEMFPEVNGNPLIPVGAHVFDNEGSVSFDKYLMNFLAIPCEKDGKYYDRYTDPEYIKWLKMFRELSQKGLLSADIFVDTRTQMEEKLSEGRYFCMLYQYTDMINQQKQLYEKDPNMIYIAVEGPRNSNGDDPALPSTSINGWTVTMISKKCKNPEKAIEFISYLMSEQGQKICYLGVEGETYDMVDGKPVIKPEVKTLLDTDRVAYDNLYGADNAYWMLQDIVMQQKWAQPLSPAEKQLKEWSRKYVVYTGQYDIFLSSDSQATQIDNKIRKLWSEVLPELLLASSEKEFDELLSDFVYERNYLGYRLYIEEATKYMNEAKEKLGIND